MEERILSKKDIWSQAQSLIRYPFQETVVLDKLFEIDIRGSLIHYKQLRNSWNVQRKREGHTMRGNNNEYDGKAYLLAKWLAQDPDEAQRFIEESSLNELPMQVRETAEVKAKSLLNTISKNSDNKMTLTQAIEPQPVQITKKQIVESAKSSAVLNVGNSTSQVQKSSICTSTDIQTSDMHTSTEIKTSEKDTSTAIQISEKHTSTEKATSENDTQTDLHHISMDDLVGAMKLLPNEEMQELVVKLISKSKISESVLMLDEQEKILSGKRKRSQSDSITENAGTSDIPVDSKRQKVQEGNQKELKAALEEEKKELDQPPLYDQVIARPRNLFREGLRFIQAREKHLEKCIVKKWASTSFFDHIYSTQRVEDSRKQSLESSKYVQIDDFGSCMIVFKSPQVEYMRHCSFQWMKKWVEEYPNATKIVIPCSMPNHWTLLWCNMKNQKYWYADSLEKDENTLLEEAKEVVRKFKLYFLQSMYVIKKLKERHEFHAKLKFNDTLNAQCEKDRAEFDSIYSKKDSTPKIVYIGKQKDQVSCGFFVAYAMQQIVLGVDQIIPLQDCYLEKVKQYYKECILVNTLPDFSQFWKALKSKSKNGASSFPDSSLEKMKHALRSQDFESMMVGYLYSICESNEGKWLKVADVTDKLLGCFNQLDFRLVEGFVRHYIHSEFEVSGYKLDVKFIDGGESVMLKKLEAFNPHFTCMKALA